MSPLKNNRLFIVLLSAFVMIIITILILPKKDDSKNLYDKFWLHKTFSEPIYDIVIMGDSRAYRGISPKKMQEYLEKRKILNFGYSSGRLNPFMFHQAENKLNPLSTKKAIIIALSPNMLTFIPDENKQILQYINMPREEKYEILYFYETLKNFKAIKFGDIFPSKNTKQQVIYYEEYKLDGWVASNKIPEDTSEAINTYMQWFTANNVSNNHINSLILQTRKWTDNHIAVYSFMMPASWSMEKLEDSLSGFNESDFSKLFIEAGGQWIVFKDNKYHSYDGSHLNKNSALKFSENLANEILVREKNK